MLALLCVPTVSTAAGTAAEVNSTVVTVDLSKVPADMALQLLDMQKKAKAAADNGSIVTDIKDVTDNLDPEKLQAWTKATGNMIKEVAGSVGLSVNEFLKTPAGWGLAGVILWKTGGPYLVDTIIDLVFGSSAWLILTSTFVWIFYKLFFAKKKVITETPGPSNSTIKVTSYEDYTAWPVDKNGCTSRDSSMIILAIAYAIVCIWLGIVVF